MYRERVIDIEAWNDFEQAMNILDAILVIRGGGGVPSQAVVLASQTLPLIVHDTWLRVIVRARAIRHYVQTQQLMLYTLLSHAYSFISRAARSFRYQLIVCINNVNQAIQVMFWNLWTFIFVHSLVAVRSAVNA